MAAKKAAMSETLMAEHFLEGHDEVAQRVQGGAANGANLLDILQNDHRAVMEALDRICDTEVDPAAARVDFLVMKSLLESHSLAEERVLYAKLRQDEDAEKVILEAESDHEMVARTLEDMCSLDITPKQWMTFAATLRDLLQEHVATEEGEIFELARNRFKEPELNRMGGEMQFEKARIFMIVA